MVLPWRVLALTKPPCVALFGQDAMAAATVTFEELDREHRRERALDAERLRTGKVTPQALQEENSLFPSHAVIKFDLVKHLSRSRRSK